WTAPLKQARRQRKDPRRLTLFYESESFDLLCVTLCPALKEISSSRQTLLPSTAEPSDARQVSDLPENGWSLSGSPTRLSPARQGIYSYPGSRKLRVEDPKGFGESPGKSETCRASVGQAAFMFGGALPAHV